MDEIIVDEDGIVIGEEDYRPSCVSRMRVYNAIRKMVSRKTIKSVAEELKIDPNKIYGGANGIGLREFENIARINGYALYCIKPGEKPIRLTDGYWKRPNGRDYEPLDELLKPESKDFEFTVRVRKHGDRIKAELLED